MSWNSHAARGSPEGVRHSISVVTDVTKLGFRPASSSGRAPALLSGDPLIPPRPSAFCLDRFASPGHSVRMQSSNLGALLAAGSREAANTTQEAPGDSAWGGAGTLDPQPGLRDSHTRHPVPRGRFLSTSPGLGSGSGLGDARGQGTRVPTRPRGPAQRGAVTARSGVGLWRGGGPSPPVTVGPPGRGPLTRCPLRWALARMGRRLFALSLRPARVTSPELSAWRVLAASPWDSSARGPAGGRGGLGLASWAGVRGARPAAAPRSLPVAQGPSAHQAGQALCTGPAVWGGRPVPQGLTPSCCQ